MNCQSLLTQHADLWRDATVHPFLTQCKTGEIQPQQFNTWLVQDHLFVVEFTRLVARSLAAAPPTHFDVILGGLAALKEELIWFHAKAAERNLDLNVAPQPTCSQYCDFMESLATEPYAAQATAFWAIELAYNQGWQLPGAMPPPYNEFADRWGNTGFTDYVKLLERQADEAMEQAEPEARNRAEAAFVEVARLEQAFWQMAYAA